MFTLRRRCAFLLLLCLAWGYAGAGQVSINPVTLQLQPNVRATQLTLSNQDAQPVTFDLSVLSWTQTGGQEALSPTQAVVVAPATVTLAPGTSQTVRVARLGSPTLDELAYRLLITERPSNTPGVSTRLQFSLPVFDGPSSSSPGDASTLPFQARLTQDGRVLLSNPGKVHLRLSGLEAQVNGRWAQVPLVYLLAGQGRLLDLKGVQALRYTSGGATSDVALK